MMRLLKTFILLFILLFFCYGGLFSKVEFRWNFGVKGGYGFTSAIFENHNTGAGSSLFSNHSPSAGIFVNLSHNEVAGLQFELLYLQKRFRRESLIGFFHTISIPILLRLDIPFGFYVNIGFSITNLLDEELGERLAPYSSSGDFEKLEYDIVFAFGWEVAIYKSLRILLESRGFYTLNNISHRYPEEIRHYGLHFYTGFVY